MGDLVIGSEYEKRFYHVGETVGIHYTITNIGPETLTRLPEQDFSEGSQLPDILDPGQSYSWTEQHTIKEDDLEYGLSDGDADIIFVPAPDREASIWATFAARGQQPVFIPLCRDAVVFAVDADNPVTDIASGDLEAVYAGRIADWSDVGGGWLGAIVPYQGGESGEAQEAFERVCAFKDLMPAPEGVTGYETWAGEATTGAASFRDLPNALGCGLYSAWAGAAPDRVKLLSVDGVAPTAENIAEGHYPFTEILYAVVLKGNDNPNVKALLDWIQSEQGRELAVKTGFAGE